MKHHHHLLKRIWEILKDTKRNFQQGEPIVYSAAIAFFTIFSLPAILIVITLIGSIFFSEEAVRTEIVELTAEIIDQDAAGQVHTVLENVIDIPGGFWGLLVAIAVVLKSATIMFFIMQKALNSVWQVTVKRDVKLMKLLGHRLITLAIVVGLGLLLVCSLLLNTILAMYSNQLRNLFAELFTPAIRTINTAFYLLVVLTFFTAIHKVLPDARIVWKDALAGGIITSLLFIIGKEIIDIILSNIKIAGIYAAAGSLVVVLLWVFYSSVILMLGAEVTKAFANNHGRAVAPSAIAVKYRKVNGVQGQDA